MSAIPAKAGWDWLKQGMALFRKQPMALTTLLFANVLFSLAISAVPWLGQIVAMVLIPSFSMSIMQACLMIEHGERVTPQVLLTGFRQPGVITLCKIGLVYLAAIGITSVLTYLMVGDVLFKQGADVVTPPVIDGATALGVTVVAVLQIATVVLLCFAAPLAYWQQMAPGKSIFYSVFAVLRSARVFLVMLMAWIALFIVANLVPRILFGNSTIGWVVTTWIGVLFILLLQCAMYAGYRQIFGVPALARKSS
jgi:hypothetical protein